MQERRAPAGVALTSRHAFPRLASLQVFNGDPGYVASYQGPLDATLSYPLFFVCARCLSAARSNPDAWPRQTLRSCFGQQQSLYQLQNQLKSYSAFSDPSVLGTFMCVASALLRGTPLLL